ncbi:hypothetical protein F4556_002751 [Kitasatospora gansuensis]|uniref:DUF4307 domain-containing protein n=1 Tax=Kitasatospora gansuensis TaxID=258050 RepID=A0A7W7SD70_9ACTN|nr:DUF4307 domain-containing protein [Kitasatospora gansuensis]MBB4947216.1 hypothetical protein [Kitasatospora gansuensis]
MDSGRTTIAPARYGKRSDREADRRLRITGLVCGALGLALVGWLGVSYISKGSAMNGLMPGFQVVSAEAMQVQLSVLKEDGTAGVCTVRAQSEDGGVVGLHDFPIPAAGSRYDEVVTLRTTARATAAELLGCAPAK